MKYKEEIEQMNEVAAALTALMRVALKDELASVEYDAEEDALIMHCGIHKLSRRVNVCGDSSATAVFDFINQTIGRKR